MSREEISNSIAQMFLSEGISETSSSIDCYNHWAQTTGNVITDPKVAAWTLSFIQSLRTTNKKFLDMVLNWRDTQ